MWVKISLEEREQQVAFFLNSKRVRCVDSLAKFPPLLGERVGMREKRPDGSERAANQIPTLPEEVPDFRSRAPFQDTREILPLCLEWIDALERAGGFASSTPGYSLSNLRFEQDLGLRVSFFERPIIANVP
jgi:hypothetical protein